MTKLNTKDKNSFSSTDLRNVTTTLVYSYTSLQGSTNANSCKSFVQWIPKRLMVKCQMSKVKNVCMQFIRTVKDFGQFAGYMSRCSLQ